MVVKLPAVARCNPVTQGGCRCRRAAQWLGLKDGHRLLPILHGGTRRGDNGNVRVVGETQGEYNPDTKFATISSSAAGEFGRFSGSRQPAKGRLSTTKSAGEVDQPPSPHISTRLMQHPRHLHFTITVASA